MPPESVVVLNPALFVARADLVGPLRPKRVTIAGRHELTALRGVYALDTATPFYRALTTPCVKATVSLLTDLDKATKGSVHEIPAEAPGLRERLAEGIKYVVKHVALDTIKGKREIYANMALRASPRVAVPEFIVVNASSACLVFRRGGDDTRVLLQEEPNALRGREGELVAALSGAIADVLQIGLVFTDFKAENVAWSADKGFQLIDFGDVAPVADFNPSVLTVDAGLAEARARDGMAVLWAGVK